MYISMFASACTMRCDEAAVCALTRTDSCGWCFQWALPGHGFLGSPLYHHITQGREGPNNNLVDIVACAIDAITGGTLVQFGGIGLKPLPDDATRAE